MRRFVSIRLDVPWDVEGIRVLLGAMTAVNRLLLRRAKRQGRAVPALYVSGVRYARQAGPERFRPWPQVLSRGTGDCDQLCAWRAAELQERGIHARAVPKRVRPDLMHVVVHRADGIVEDPSRRLGMKSRKRK